MIVNRQTAIPQTSPWFEKVSRLKTQNHSLQLSGILTMNNRRVALINNEIYEQGEMIKNMQIKEIAADHVVLLKDGQTSILKLR